MTTASGIYPTSNTVTEAKREQQPRNQQQISNEIQKLREQPRPVQENQEEQESQIVQGFNARPPFFNSLAPNTSVYQQDMDTFKAQQDETLGQIGGNIARLRNR